MSVVIFKFVIIFIEYWSKTYMCFKKIAHLLAFLGFISILCLFFIFVLVCSTHCGNFEKKGIGRGYIDFLVWCWNVLSLLNHRICEGYNFVDCRIQPRIVFEVEGFFLYRFRWVIKFFTSSLFLGRCVWNSLVMMSNG